jgi:uncharacterized protein (DUF885 family)
MPFNAFVDSAYLELLGPESKLRLGLPQLAGDSAARWGDASLDHAKSERRLAEAALARLGRYDRKALSSEDRITYDEFKWFLDEQAGSAATWKFENIDVPYAGVHTEILDFLTGAQGIGSFEKARSWGGRYADIPRYLDQAIAWMRWEEAEGYIPPRPLIEETLSQLGEIIDAPPSRNILIAYFGQRIEKVIRSDMSPDTAERRRLGDELVARVNGGWPGSVRPAFSRYRDAVAAALPRAPAEGGLCRYRGGAAAYRFMLRLYCSLDVTPEEVKSLAEKEAARVGRDLEHLCDPGSEPVAARAQALLGSEPLIDAQDEISLVSEILAEEKPRLSLWFSSLHSENLVVRPSVAPAGMPSYYQSGSLDGRSPATFFIPRTRATSFQASCFELMTFHEAIPGHYFQIALQAENAQLPFFRRIFGSPAFNEGWAVYAEHLAAGNVANDWLRIRLLLDDHDIAEWTVADVGLNAEGWTWMKARNFIMENTSESSFAAAQERLNRLLSDPGQSAAYFMGYREMRKLRDEAEAHDGSAFSLKAFHARLLGEGALPLSQLEPLMSANLP